MWIKNYKWNGLLIEQALKTDEILYNIVLSTQLRKKIRKVCITTPACIGQITGLGKFGYILAVVYLIEYYNK